MESEPMDSKHRGGPNHPSKQRLRPGAEQPGEMMNTTATPTNHEERVQRHAQRVAAEVPVEKPKERETGAAEDGKRSGEARRRKVPKFVARLLQASPAGVLPLGNKISTTCADSTSRSPITGRVGHPPRRSRRNVIEIDDEARAVLSAIRQRSGLSRKWIASKLLTMFAEWEGIAEVFVSHTLAVADNDDLWRVVENELLQGAARLRDKIRSRDTNG